MNLRTEKPVNLLVTGSSGFVGQNLCSALERRAGVRVFRYDRDGTPRELEAGLARADIVFHLAGVNRPPAVEDFERGNAGFTRELCSTLIGAGRSPKLVLSSSVHVERDEPYGRSKLAAEDAVRSYCGETGATGRIYRLKNLFGKWCRAEYNSVTATFCHKIARGLPIEISDPEATVELTYIDDVVTAFLGELSSDDAGDCAFADSLPSHAISLGELASLISSFRDHRRTLQVPDFSSYFVRALYATYLSYLPTDDFGYGLEVKADNRGSLAELLKSPPFGQIFVSRTKPGITRGNHYHHTKVEKFIVVQGQAIIRFRGITGADVIEYRVAGDDFRVVDIPPGYTHSIENVGSEDLVTLFWASEVFDPDHPDTYRLPVLGDPADT